jgi:hypothetical protein
MVKRTTIVKTRVTTITITAMSTMMTMDIIMKLAMSQWAGIGRGRVWKIHGILKKIAANIKAPTTIGHTIKTKLELIIMMIVTAVNM